MHMLQPWTFGCRLRTRLWPYHFGIGTWYLSTSYPYARQISAKSAGDFTDAGCANRAEYARGTLPAHGCDSEGHGPGVELVDVHGHRGGDAAHTELAQLPLAGRRLAFPIAHLRTLALIASAFSLLPLPFHSTRRSSCRGCTWSPW